MTPDADQPQSAAETPAATTPDLPPPAAAAHVTGDDVEDVHEDAESTVADDDAVVPDTDVTEGGAEPPD